MYVCSVCEHGVKVCSWTAKSCVVPTKVHAMPRLELLGSVLLSKLVASVKLAVEKMLKVTKVVRYSDSQIVLWWLRLIWKDWKLWAENRVQIVAKNVAPRNWFYVWTDRNAAYLATRLKSLVCLKGCLLWWQDPEFLQSQEVVMPSQQFLELDVLPEQKSTVMFMVAKCKKVVGIGEVIDCCRFSSLRALLRITGYALQFIFNLKSKIKGQSDLREGEIIVEKIDESKELWVKYEQYFIQKDSKCERMKNPLNLYFNENSLIHSKTRFSELTEMSYKRKHPLSMRNNSYFTNLIVVDSHEKVFHNGVNVTLNFI